MALASPGPAGERKSGREQSDWLFPAKEQLIYKSYLTLPTWSQTRLCVTVGSNSGDEDAVSVF